MADDFNVIGLLIIMTLVVVVGWIVPIVLGTSFARGKGYSPNWMWFGIYPITGWIAMIVLACLPRRVQCPHCGGFIGAQFRICPYCRTTIETTVSVASSKVNSTLQHSA